MPAYIDGIEIGHWFKIQEDKLEQKKAEMDLIGKLLFIMPIEQEENDLGSYIATANFLQRRADNRLNEIIEIEESMKNASQFGLMAQAMDRS